MSTSRVVVVGGGVIGLSCAYSLMQAGLDVVVVERETIGAGASSGNAGTVSAGHPPLNRPGRIKQAVTQMMDPTSPLYVKPRWDPELWRWLLTFARYCTDEHVERAMKAMGPLGQDALVVFDELVEREDIDCGYDAGGYYDVCSSERGLAHATHEAEIIQRHGYRPEVVDGDELRRREPALGPSVLGGVHYPEARTLDPGCFLSALRDRLERKGAAVREGVSVTGVEQVSGKVTGVTTGIGESLGADAVVVATGPFVSELTRRLGSPLPVQPGKGYHRDVAIGDQGAPDLRIACVFNETSIFMTPMRGFVRFAGTMEFSGANRTMRPARLEQLTRGARRYVPTLGTGAAQSEWCGLRPMSVDGMPIVGELQALDGVSVATGHGMLGLTLGPVTGDMIANQILGRPDPRLEAYSPARFGA